MVTTAQQRNLQMLAQKQAAKGKTTSLTKKLSSGGFSGGITGTSSVKSVNSVGITTPSLKGIASSTSGVGSVSKGTGGVSVKPVPGLAKPALGGAIQKKTVGLTNKGTPPKNTMTAGADTFGQISGKSVLGQTVTPGARLSTGQTITKETAKAGDLGNLSVWGAAAIQANQKDNTTLARRNDQVVQNLLTQGITDQAGIKAYLESQPGFLQATPQEQANTLRGLTEQMGIGQGGETEGGALATDTTQGSPEYDMEGYLRAKEQSDLVQQTEEQKAYEQKQREREIQIRDLEGNIITIQNNQELDNANKQIENMRQQFGFLGTGGQPGVSAGHIDAMKDQIKDAEKTYAQLKQIIQNKEQARALGLEIDEAAFTQRMKELQSNLDSQVSAAVQEKINSINALSEGGKIDTMEELEQVKGTMMQELDKSIANIAIATIADRKLILDRYNQVIQQGQQFVENKNTVNADMSAVKGYYVDGNGNPIMGDNGMPIPMAKEAPMKPIFQDGQLITFSTGANGEIVAKTQQITDKPAMESKAMIDVMGAISEGKISAQAAAQLFPSMAGAIQAQSAAMSGGVTSPTYQGPTIPPVQPAQVEAKFQDFVANAKDGTKIGQGRCGEFVNTYLASMGLPGQMYKDPIDIRKTQTNSTVATPGSIAVIDYKNNPNVSDVANKYGHVALVESINADGSLNIVESNGKNKMAIGRRTIPANTVAGFFDPRLGLQPGRQQGGGISGMEQQGDLADMSEDFNRMSSTQISKLKGPEKEQYQQWQREKQAIDRDPKSTVEDRLRYSAGGKPVSDSFMQSFDKMSVVVNQLGSLQDAITGGDAEYFKGVQYKDEFGNQREMTDDNVNILERGLKYLTKWNKADASVDRANAILQGVIPNLARGVYGEVGVLTDSDINNYKKTIMTANSPAEVQAVVQTATLKTVLNSLSSKLKTQAAAGKDVSGYEGDYLALKQQVESMENQILGVDRNMSIEQAQKEGSANNAIAAFNTLLSSTKQKAPSNVQASTSKKQPATQSTGSTKSSGASRSYLTNL